MPFVKALGRAGFCTPSSAAHFNKPRPPSFEHAYRQSSTAEHGNKIATDFPQLQWTTGMGLGGAGSFYVHVSSVADTMVFSGQCIRGGTNNHPQFVNVFQCQPNDLSRAGLLLPLIDTSNDWWQIGSPMPDDVFLEIAGSSIMRYGYNYPDTGVRFTCQFYSNGLLLAASPVPNTPTPNGWDDCGENGNDPDGDFNDKASNLWFPLVYGQDFTKINIRGAGGGGANLLEFE